MACTSNAPIVTLSYICMYEHTHCYCYALQRPSCPCLRQADSHFMTISVLCHFLRFHSYSLFILYTFVFLLHFILQIFCFVFANWNISYLIFVWFRALLNVCDCVISGERSSGTHAQIVFSTFLFCFVVVLFCCCFHVVFVLLLHYLNKTPFPAQLNNNGHNSNNNSVVHLSPSQTCAFCQRSGFSLPSTASSGLLQPTFSSLYSRPLSTTTRWSHYIHTYICMDVCLWRGQCACGKCGFAQIMPTLQLCNTCCEKLKPKVCIKPVNWAWKWINGSTSERRAEGTANFMVKCRKKS